MEITLLIAKARAWDGSDEAKAAVQRAITAAEMLWNSHYSNEGVVEKIIDIADLSAAFGSAVDEFKAWLAAQTSEQTGEQTGEQPSEQPA